MSTWLFVIAIVQGVNAIIGWTMYQIEQRKRRDAEAELRERNVTVDEACRALLGWAELYGTRAQVDAARSATGQAHCWRLEHEEDWT